MSVADRVAALVQKGPFRVAAGHTRPTRSPPRERALTPTTRACPGRTQVCADASDPASKDHRLAVLVNDKITRKVLKTHVGRDGPLRFANAGHWPTESALGVRGARIVCGVPCCQIVKQTVMTNVYGVTFVGARQQIANRLKEKEVVAEEDMYKCSIYITRQVRVAREWRSRARRRRPHALDAGAPRAPWIGRARE